MDRRMKQTHTHLAGPVAIVHNGIIENEISPGRARRRGRDL